MRQCGSRQVQPRLPRATEAARAGKGSACSIQGALQRDRRQALFGNFRQQRGQHLQDYRAAIRAARRMPVVEQQYVAIT